MKTRLLIIIGIAVTLATVFYVLGPSQGDIAEYFLNDEQFEDIILSNDNEDRYSAHDESFADESKVTGNMVQEICSITGGECPPNYFANVLDDGSKMVAVTNWDADTKIEKSFVFVIKNNTLSYDVNVIDKDVRPHQFGTTTEKKQYHVDPIYTENPNNPGELVLDLDSMQKVLEILDWCHRESLGLGVLDIGLSFNNETHYIDNNTCEWKSISGKTVTGSYELEGALCIGGRGMIKNENCEIIGRYDPATGMPIVENKEQCDMLEGDWDEEQKICDSKYGGK